MAALLDGVLEVHGPEARGRRENHDIDVGEHVLVGVEARVPTRLRNIDQTTDVSIGAEIRGQVLARQVPVAAVDSILEGIGHGDELHVLTRGKRLDRSAGPASTTPDETDSDGVLARGARHGPIPREGGNRAGGRRGRERRHGERPERGRRRAHEASAVHRGASETI